MEKIVILDAYTSNPGDLSWDELKNLGTLTVYDRTLPEETISRIADADIVLTNKVNIDANVMAACPNIKYIGVLATGFNVVDLEEATRRGIIVTNIPAYSTDSVAQMVFAHLLAVTNRVEHYTEQIHKGTWSRNADFSYHDTTLTELAGKTIGIVGLGHIGMRVAHIALAMGMHVMAKTSKGVRELPEEIQKATMEGLLASSDIITLHCPLSSSTHHLINSERLAQMRHGAILINTARGPLVDEETVAIALQDGQLAAYCADVMDNEPPRADNPLLHAPNTFFTPHIAWATQEARRRLVDIAIKNVKAYTEGSAINVVNK